MEFQDRLTDIRTRAGLSQRELAAKLGTARATISLWEIGARTPEVGHLTALSDLFGVTTDYLLGRSDDPHGARPATQDPSSPKQQLLTALADWELTHDDVEAVLDVLVGRRTRRRETV